MEINDFITKRNVLVGVDTQIDFTSGSLAIQEGEQVVDPLNQLARAVRRSMGRVAYTRDWHPKKTPHFDIWPEHCVAGSEGAEFHPDLEILPEDTIISKGMGQTHGYSGMEGVSDDGQTLESIIDPQGRWEEVRVFIGGLATDFCDKATAIDGKNRFRDYKNVEFYAIREAMRAVNLAPGDGDAAIAEMAEAGIKIISLEDALRIIDGSRLER